jgi:2-keto-4-pentenoate hydratase/2-oxohepta-3-ene-1,7-dioic acid hydratase in catechol pathway
VGFPRSKFLKGGDVVEAEVEGIGRLRNYVVEEK